MHHVFLFSSSLLSVSTARQLKSLKTRSQRAWPEGRTMMRKSCFTPLTAPPSVEPRCSWHLHRLGGFICQQYTGATYSSCLFSPLADVSTSSGMHSSCPSFTHVTNVCLAVSKIRSPSFFFLSLALVFPSIFSL